MIEARSSATPEALEAALTPGQISALKLAKLGDLHPQSAKTWTHLDATVTYARSDRFRERPIKIKSATTVTVERLQELGFLESADRSPGTEAPQKITMAGKLWLLKHK